MLLGCVGATLINPWGVEGALYPFLIFENYGYPVEENMPMWPHLFHYAEGLHFAFVFVLAVLAAGRTVIAPEGGDRKLPMLLMTLVFGVLAWQHYRAIAIFGFIALAALPHFGRRRRGSALRRFLEAATGPDVIVGDCRRVFCGASGAVDLPR